jgi:glycosyltransferase involved in cell wall biosynthesis
MVVFLNRYPKYESEELGIQIHHPNLITSPIQKFDLDHFIENTPPSIWKKPPAVLIEFPLDDFLSLAKRLKDLGCTVIYDLLDEWDTSLGSTWYTRKTEQEIITLSDLLVATAPGLKSRLQELSGRPVHLLPNAVNLHIFNAASSHPVPEDYPAGKRSVIYTGALWGDWFDWELLIEICHQYPELNVVMVGDYHGQSPEHPPNLYFLGLKPQWSLPAYLAHADVAFIPWKINEITKATSPLKVYEYLAMRKPVVAPDLPPLNGIPYVLRSKTRQEFSSNIQEALTLQVHPAEIDRFVNQNSWDARLDQLIYLIEERKTADRSPKIPPGE